MKVAAIPEDEQLIERFLLGALGDADLAFEALVIRHRPAIMSVCRRVLVQREDAEDAAQATSWPWSATPGRYATDDACGPGSTASRTGSASA